MYLLALDTPGSPVDLTAMYGTGRRGRAYNKKNKTAVSELLFSFPFLDFRGLHCMVSPL